MFDPKEVGICRLGAMVLFAAPLLVSAAGRESQDSSSALLRAADAPRHVLSEGVMRVRAVVQHEEEITRTTLDVYVRSPDRALCVFRDGKLKGRRVLMTDQRVWLLLPDTTHPIRVSPNQRLFGGASIGDVARLRFADEFTARPETTEEVVDGVPCDVVTLSGRRGSAYGSGTLWLGTEDGLPRRAVLSLPSGKAAKDLRFTAYGVENGRTVLRRLEIHHLLPSERATVTTLEFTAYEQKSLPENLFDPKHARILP